VSTLTLYRGARVRRPDPKPAESMATPPKPPPPPSPPKPPSSARPTPAALTKPPNPQRDAYRAALQESEQLPWDRPFYFLWSPSEQTPKRRHLTLESAQAEAARLTALFPEKSFLVFEARPVVTGSP
jgi:hypothetical protein